MSTEDLFNSEMSTDSDEHKMYYCNVAILTNHSCYVLGDLSNGRFINRIIIIIIIII